MEHSKQLNLFNETLPPSVAIEDSARRLGVSTATIRNWIKTKYLEEGGKGSVTCESLERFQSEFSGKEKLTSRANKSFKDYHNHKKTVARFLNKVLFSAASLDRIANEYEVSLSDSYRNKEGVYYTPIEVVNDLFSLVKNEFQDASFCDPCCGSGNFIIRAIELGFKPENIFGFDIDPVAVEITKARIYKATGYKSENIQVADFLDVATSPTLPKRKKRVTWFKAWGRIQY